MLTVGRYFLDPDGPSREFFPFEVYCDLTNGKMKAVIHHDHGEEVTSCDVYWRFIDSFLCGLY